MKDYKNNIPAWSYSRSRRVEPSIGMERTPRRVEPSSGIERKAQMDPADNFAGQDENQPQPEAQQGTGVYVQYSFPFHITANVEYNPDNAKGLEEARAKMEEIYRKLYSMFGDNASDSPDTAVRSMRGSLDSKDVSLYSG